MPKFKKDLPLIDEELTKVQPDYYYNGCVPEDVDALDYVNFNLKGVVVG